MGLSTVDKKFSKYVAQMNIYILIFVVSAFIIDFGMVVREAYKLHQEHKRLFSKDLAKGLKNVQTVLNTTQKRFLTYVKGRQSLASGHKILQNQYSHVLAKLNVLTNGYLFLVDLSKTRNSILTQYGQTDDLMRVFSRFDVKNKELKGFLVKTSSDLHVLVLKKVENKPIVVGMQLMPSYLLSLLNKYGLMDRTGKGVKTKIDGFNLEVMVKDFEWPKVHHYLQNRLPIIMLLALIYLMFLVFSYRIFNYFKKIALSSVNEQFSLLRSNNRENKSLIEKMVMNEQKLRTDVESFKKTIRFRALLVNKVFNNHDKLDLFIKYCIEEAKADGAVKYEKLFNKLGAVLSVSEIEGEIETVNIEDVMQNVINILAVDLIHRKINIVTEYINRGSLRCDSVKLQVILYNILKRAIKRTANKENVKIRVEKDKKFVKIIINDKGFNFAEKDILNMLIDKQVYDNLSLDFDNLQQIVKGVDGNIQEVLSNKGNELQFILPIKCKENKKDATQKIVQLFN